MANTNVHSDVTDPGGKKIAVVDTTGSVFLHPSSGIPATIAKTATGQIANVRGVVPGTTVVFENQISK